MYSIARDSHPITADEFWSLAEKFPKLEFLDDKSLNIYILTDTENYEYPMSLDEETGAIVAEGNGEVTDRIFRKIREIAKYLKARIVDDDGNIYSLSGDLFEIIDGPGKFVVHSEIVKKGDFDKFREKYSGVIFLIIVFIYFWFTDFDIFNATSRNAARSHADEFQRQIVELKSSLSRNKQAVNIMATNEFDPAMARRLADQLARDTGLRVTLLEPLWLGVAAADDGQQNSVSDLLDLAHAERVTRGLTDASIPLIILTSVPMFDLNSSDAFKFEGYNPETRTAFISINAMNQRDWLFRSNTVGEYRMANYLKRMVGRLLFALPPSEERENFMNRRVRSAADIDFMALY